MFKKENGKCYLEWDGGEKFYVYDYENDLDILLNKFDNKELKEQIKNVYKDPVDIENNYWNYWE